MHLKMPNRQEVPEEILEARKEGQSLPVRQV